MSTTSKIALRIYGGGVTTGLNKSPIVSVGDMPKGFSPTLPTLVNEQQCWIITHAPNYTLYELLSKRCRTSDDEPGQVFICIFFSPEKRLGDGVSPQMLLDSVMDCLSVQVLRGGKLPIDSVDNTPFQTLLENYRTERRPMELPVMLGSQPAAFCLESKAQLDALMRHSRYQQLSSVSRLELGFECTSTISLYTSGVQQSTKNKEKTIATANKREEVTIENSSTTYNGLYLGEEPSNKSFEETSHGKKKMIFAAAAIILIALCWFIISSVTNNKDNNTEHYLAEESVAEEVFIDEPLIVQDNANVTENTSALDNSQMSKDVVANNQAEDEANKKLEEAKKKAEQEAKKKAEEEARKKEIENSWQTEIKSHSQKCPIQLRIGVKITSITYTDNMVTYTVNYEELSKYNMSSYDKDDLTEDLSTIIKEYGATVPARVKINIIQKDKAGRNI